MFSATQTEPMPPSPISCSNRYLSLITSPGAYSLRGGVGSIEVPFTVVIGSAPVRGRGAGEVEGGSSRSKKSRPKSWAAQTAPKDTPESVTKALNPQEFSRLYRGRSSSLG